MDDDERQRLLSSLAALPGVTGSLIVGQDGRPIANKLPQEYDPETVGILSLGIYVNAKNAIRQIAHKLLHQLVARTKYGFLIIVTWRGEIVVTLSNFQKTDELITLMRSITQLIALGK